MRVSRGATLTPCARSLSYRVGGRRHACVAARTGWRAARRRGKAKEWRLRATLEEVARLRGVQTGARRWRGSDAGGGALPGAPRVAYVPAALRTGIRRNKCSRHESLFQCTTEGMVGHIVYTRLHLPQYMLETYRDTGKTQQHITSISFI